MKTRILLSMAFAITFFQEEFSNQFATQVYTGDVTLISQAAVDAFNCTALTGKLTISGSDITNFHRLYALI